MNCEIFFRKRDTSLKGVSETNDLTAVSVSRSDVWYCGSRIWILNIACASDILRLPFCLMRVIMRYAQGGAAKQFVVANWKQEVGHS